MCKTLPQLFECPKLHAKLTLASCEANRKKPKKIWGRASESLRPSQCEDCQDWKSWTAKKAVKIEYGEI